MEKREIVQFWLDSSDDNYNSMENMFKAGEYAWSLFIGHLAIEKLLKAHFAQFVGGNLPRTHDLLKLATSTGLELNEAQKDILQYITLFNIETRYEDYKRDFCRKCTKEFAEANIARIKELREWLKKEI